MCKDANMAATEAHDALDRVINKIELQSKNQRVNVQSTQDMWLPVPPESIQSGFMKMQGLGQDEEGNNYLLVKINPDSVSVIHYHEQAIEKVQLVKGKLYFKVFEDENHTKIKRSGFLSKPCQFEEFEPGEWHLVLTSIIETYILIIFKEKTYKQ